MTAQRPTHLDDVALRAAIILFDRPAVGPGGFRARSRLPDTVSIDASVSGTPIRCEVSRAVVHELSGATHVPSWEHLQQVWQTIAALLERKIRAGGANPLHGRGVPTVTLTVEDLREAS